MKKPLQPRSVASTNRMLDAAEALLAEGGHDALTVEAVIAKSGTSAGAFYARFGDRAGMLEAMHARFLDRIHAFTEALVVEAQGRSSLAESVGVLVAGVLTVARDDRDSLVFFVVFNAFDKQLRGQGIRAKVGFARAFAAGVSRHRREIAHPNPDLAVDVAFRMLMAMFVQQVMFAPREVTGRAISHRAMTAEIVRCLVAYLTCTGS